MMTNVFFAIAILTTLYALYRFYTRCPECRSWRRHTHTHGAGTTYGDEGQIIHLEGGGAFTYCKACGLMLASSGWGHQGPS